MHCETWYIGVIRLQVYCWMLSLSHMVCMQEMSYVFVGWPRVAIKNWPIQFVLHFSNRFSQTERKMCFIKGIPFMTLSSSARIIKVANNVLCGFHSS